MDSQDRKRSFHQAVFHNKPTNGSDLVLKGNNLSETRKEPASLLSFPNELLSHIVGYLLDCARDASIAWQVAAERPMLEPGSPQVRHSLVANGNWFINRRTVIRKPHHDITYYRMVFWDALSSVERAKIGPADQRVESFCGSPDHKCQFLVDCSARLHALGLAREAFLAFRDLQNLEASRRKLSVVLLAQEKRYSTKVFRMRPDRVIISQLKRLGVQELIDVYRWECKSWSKTHARDYFLSKEIKILTASEREGLLIPTIRRYRGQTRQKLVKVWTKIVAERQLGLDLANSSQISDPMAAFLGYLGDIGFLLLIFRK